MVRIGLGIVILLSAFTDLRAGMPRKGACLAAAGVILILWGFLAIKKKEADRDKHEDGDPKEL